MKVLIADDEAVSRRLLQNYLQKWGHDVTVAENGADAWRHFEAGAFPVVITDWEMPGMNGVELIRRIRAASESGSGYVYAILLTAKAQKEDLVEGMEAGADDFLTKPFDRDELRVRLRAGERIMLLEHNLRQAKAALAQVGTPADIGQTEAAPTTREANGPIDVLHETLPVIRRDVLAVLRLLDKYREGRAALAAAAPQIAAEAARMEQEFELSHVREKLPGLLDRCLRQLGAPNNNA
jgi:DNA-binding response OmpR family regulator